MSSEKSWGTRQTVGLSGAVHRAQPLRVQRRRDPEAGSADLGPEAPPESFELRGGRQPRAHELHLVEHPLGVVVQQCEVHRPTEAAHRVAAHQRAADQHVLSPDEDGGALRVLIPWWLVLSAHEQVDVGLRVWEASLPGCGEGSEPAQPGGRVVGRLIGERAHREAVHQAARYGLRRSGPLPQPREDHGCGLAEPGGGNECVRPVALRQRLLVGERLGSSLEGAREEFGEGHESALSFSSAPGNS